MDNKLVTCIAATTELDSNDMSFSEENILELNEQMSNKVMPIYDNFDNNKCIGYVLDTYVNNNMLHITCSIGTIYNDLYIVPGFKVLGARINEDNGIIYLTDVELVCFGTTNCPSEMGVTKFKEVEDGGQ